MQTIIDNLEKNVNDLERKNQHIENQIEMFEDMIHNYKLDFNTNETDIIQLTNAIEQLKKPS